MTRKVLSLIRVSSADQAADDRTGIQRQLEDISIHCRTHGLEVIKEYRLEGISGAYVERSPLFQDMLSRLKQKNVAGVVFASLDRFFRPENLSAYDVLRPFETARKLLFCDLGELDPRNQQDQMKIAIWGQMAGMERTRIKDRMVRGKEFKRSDPTSPTDKLPRGVVFENGLFRYTEDSKRVREAFKRILAGQTLKEVADDLGFTSGTALRVTLKSRWWIGVKACLYRREYGDVRRTKADGSLAEGRKVAREQPVEVPTNLAKTPLVKPADYQAVQDLLNQHSRTWTLRQSRQNNFLGTGLLMCACGRKFYHKQDQRKGKVSYYMCASRWNNLTPCGHPNLNADKLDRAITWGVMAYLTDQRVIEQEIRKSITTDKRADMQEEHDRLAGSVAALEQKMQRALDFALEHPEFISRVTKLKEEIARERTNLTKAKRELAAHIEDKDITRLAKSIKDRFWKFDEWTKQEQKAVLAQYVDELVVDANEMVSLKIKTGLPVPDGRTLSDRFDEQHPISVPDPLHSELIPWTAEEKRHWSKVNAWRKTSIRVAADSESCANPLGSLAITLRYSLNKAA